MPYTQELALTGVIACAAAVVTAKYAALSAGSQLFGHTIIAGRDPSEYALTYDDGPNDRCTLALLDILAAHSVRATFFMVGRHVRQHPGIARVVHAAGHLVGNHTETHPWLVLKSNATIQDELRSCNAALEDALGAPVHYFRPPHGARRPFVLRAAAELGLKTVQWNAMGKDWQPIGPETIVANLDRGIERAHSRFHGANLLLHDGDGLRMSADRSATLEATKILLERASAGGHRFVTVDAWA